MDGSTGTDIRGPAISALPMASICFGSRPGPGHSCDGEGKAFMRNFRDRSGKNVRLQRVLEFDPERH
ncbi:hypothetical protein QFZ24_009574 [Streptomyces phaeochromogenes]|nr:hypothetical protein [Streptomyces phaeochromogenes]